MKRIQLNFLIDVTAFAGFILLTTTGVLMRYVLPPRSGQRMTIWGLDRHEWGELHFWISVGFFGLLFLHLLLHWRWVLSVVAGRPREGSGFRLALGVLGLLVLIAFAVSPLVTPVEEKERDPGDGPGKGPPATYRR